MKPAKAVCRYTVGRHWFVISISLILARMTPEIHKNASWKWPGLSPNYSAIRCDEHQLGNRVFHGDFMRSINIKPSWENFIYITQSHKLQTAKHKTTLNLRRLVQIKNNSTKKNLQQGEKGQNNREGIHLPGQTDVNKFCIYRIDQSSNSKITIWRIG